MTLITLSKWSIQAGGILGVDADEQARLDTVGWLRALPRLSQEQGPRLKSVRCWRASGWLPRLPEPGRTGVRAFLFILLLVWLLLGGTLWSQAGLAFSADGLVHLHRAAAMTRAWSQGVFWPRWFPDVYQGLGAPVFHFYSPLFYMGMAALHLAGLPLDLAAKTLFSSAFVLSGLAIWAWLRRLLTPTAGLIGASLYLSQPLFYREFYFQGDYPQLLALLWLPVVFWAFTRLHDQGRWFDWLLAPFSLTILVLTHNITAILGAGVLAAYWLALLLARPNRRGWLAGLMGMILAAGLSALFWLPALADADLVHFTNLRQGFFTFSRHFVRWQDLLAAPPLLDSRAGNPPFPHMLGWAAWLALAASALVLGANFLRDRRPQPARGWAIVGAILVAACLTLTQTWSAPIWENAPLLPLLQFPSRLLGPAAIGIVLIAGSAAAVLPERWATRLLLLILIAVIASASVFLFPRQPYARWLSFTPADTQAYERATGAWGTTGSNEFLPRWASSPPLSPPALPPGATWSWETPQRAVLKNATKPLPAGDLTLPLHYFPAWVALTETEPIPLQPTAGGLTRATLPQPTHELTFTWRGTRAQRLAAWISGITLFLWLAGAGATARRGKRLSYRRPSPSPPPALSRSFLPHLVLLLAILATFGLARSGLDWLQRASPPDAVLGVEHPLHIDLGGERPPITLLGWDRIEKAARPGGRIQVRLYWQGTDGLPVPLHSFAHLYTPATRQSWVIAQNQNPGNIPTRQWIPGLYYVDDLVLDLPPDLPPGLFSLAVGMVDETGNRLAVPGNPDSLVLLDDISVAPLSAGRRQPLRPTTPAPAVFGDAIRLQGYDLLPDPGGPILRLYWEVLHPPAAPVVAFIHLIDAQDRILAQYDGPLAAGLTPPDSWHPGDLLIDRRKLQLPDGLPPGPYRYLVGLYEPAAGVRLPVRPEDNASNAYHNEALTIPQPIP